MKNRFVIIDTSVFIDFFRGGKTPKFESLVKENRAVLSRYVRLELLLGIRGSEVSSVRSALSGLIQLIHQREVFQEAEILLSKLRSSGITVGTVDLLIAAEARLHGYAVLSHDKVFSRMASSNLVTKV